ncbi:VQ motif-containing protein 20-like [Salvia divinorum]|uniref:VQ motif-containing protein 20-like n=1 Tax=Salvia divinorum TaxID=28513 RepID=A0ABD1FJX9_SALDI
MKKANFNGAINGQRPPPLRTGKDSHAIQKPARRRQPVIIYMHSPKVIIAAPDDFMKLVQRLTGLSSNDDGSPPPPAAEAEVFSGDEESNCEMAEAEQDPAMHKTSSGYVVEAAGLGDFFCSPRTGAAAEASAISPSFMEYFKMYPDYLN